MAARWVPCSQGRPPAPSPRLEVPITSQELAQAVAAAAAEKKASDLTILDIQKLVAYCDHFVICSGTNTRQVRAIAQHAMETLEAQGRKPQSVEGLQASRWILVDYGDVILHVFDEELRRFYDLDGLWGDAPRVVPAAPVAAPAPQLAPAPAG